jgi:PEP-CTERM motif
MRRPMRRGILVAAVLGLMAATMMTSRAGAGAIVSFTYLGRGAPDGNGGLTSNGTGSFSFADGLSTVGKSDLTSFHFDLEENTPNTTIFGLKDLKSFSATVGPGPTLTSLALDTYATEGPDPTSYPREFTISSLEPPDAETHVVIFGFPLFWTSGTITIISVTAPEPSSLTLAILGIGVVIVAGGWSRRRKSRATG